MENADNPEVELLIESTTMMKKLLNLYPWVLGRKLEQYNNDTKVLNLILLGYTRLHEYVNGLCGYVPRRLFGFME